MQTCDDRIRIGMLPYPQRGDWWEEPANPHLFKIVDELTLLGWEVVPVEREDILGSRLSEKNIRLLLVHWPSALFDLHCFSSTGVFLSFSCYMQQLVRPFNVIGGRAINFMLRVAPWIFQGLHETCVYMQSKRRIGKAIKALEASGVPVVWEQHDLWSHDFTNGGPMLNLDRQLRTGLFRSSKAIILHEQSCLAPIVQAFGSHPRYAIAPLGPYFYGVNVSKSEARRRLGIPATARVISHVGSARPNRNPRLTFESFLKVAGEEDRLLIAGMGTRAYLPERLSDPRVTVLGELQPPQTMRDIFCAADFVVNDAECYLTSAVVRAAMGYGVPVIARPFGATVDMAKGAGLFIEKCGIDEALEKALTMKEAEIDVMRREALARDRERTWQGCGESLDCFFRSLLGIRKSN